MRLVFPNPLQFGIGLVDAAENGQGIYIYQTSQEEQRLDLNTASRVVSRILVVLQTFMSE